MLINLLSAAVQTGDTSQPLLYIAIAGGAGVLLIIFTILFKRK